MGGFHTASLMLASSICERLLTCHYSVGATVLKIFCQFPSCCKTWSMFLNSVPLSNKMYCGHMCTGKYSFMKVETIVSAALSGVGNASGHPVR